MWHWWCTIIAGCPSGLIFAPEGAPCLEFDFTVRPLDATSDKQELILSFAQDMTLAIANGDLYTKIVEGNPFTLVNGVGVPE